MSQILITRPLEDALALENTLKTKGLNTLVVPLFSPIFFPVPHLRAPQGLIISSKNAVRAIQSMEEIKHLPLYGVGDQTVRFACELGFANAFSASGEGQDLMNLILNDADPKKGILYHLSGNIIKVDFVKELQEKGFQAKREIVYSLQAVDNFPDFLIDSLDNGGVSHILFFSNQTAKTFMKLIEKNSLSHMASHMVALCMSQNVAQAVQTISWKKVWISPQPHQESMVEYFNGKQ